MFEHHKHSGHAFSSRGKDGIGGGRDEVTVGGGKHHLPGVWPEELQGHIHSPPEPLVFPRA